MVVFSVVFGMLSAIHVFLFSFHRSNDRDTKNIIGLKISFFILSMSTIVGFLFFRIRAFDLDEENSLVFGNIAILSLPVLIIFPIHDIRNDEKIQTIVNFSNIFIRNFSIPMTASGIVMLFYFVFIDFFRDVSVIGIILIHAIIAWPIWILFSMISLAKYIDISLKFNSNEYSSKNTNSTKESSISTNFEYVQNFITVAAATGSSLLCYGYANASMIMAMNDLEELASERHLNWALIACGAAAASHAYFLAKPSQNRILKLWARWHWALVLPPLLSATWLTFLLADFHVTAMQVILLTISFVACTGSLLNIHRNLVGLLSIYLFFAVICHAAFA